MTYSLDFPHRAAPPSQAEFEALLTTMSLCDANCDMQGGDDAVGSQGSDVEAIRTFQVANQLDMLFCDLTDAYERGDIEPVADALMPLLFARIQLEAILGLREESGSREE